LLSSPADEISNRNLFINNKKKHPHKKSTNEWGVQTLGGSGCEGWASTTVVAGSWAAAAVVESVCSTGVTWACVAAARASPRPHVSASAPEEGLEWKTLNEFG
jgi:hypothetical protein